MKPAIHAQWKSATRSEHVPLFSHGLEAQSSISLKKGKVISVKTKLAHILYGLPTPLFHDRLSCISGKTKVVILMTTSFPSVRANAGIQDG